MSRTKVLSLVKRATGGVTTIWETLAKESPEIDVVYFRTGERTFFCPQTRTLDYNLYDPLCVIYKRLAREVRLDEYRVAIANDEFGLSFLASRPRRPPVAFVVHLNHDYWYRPALSYAGFIDHYFCVSRQAESYLRSRDLESVSTIAYSVSLPWPVVPEKRNRVAFIGRFVPDKNLEETIELFAFLKKNGMEVLFIGYGPMERELRRSFDPEEVLVNPDKATLYRKMAESKFLCLLSYMEGLPVVYIEAMHFGLGVICNYVDRSIAELLGENYIFLCKPEQMLQRIQEFRFQPPPGVSRVNNRKLNEELVSRFQAVSARRTPARPRPPGSPMDRLVCCPAVLIRMIRKLRWKLRGHPPGR
jgi:glycosyltransferase involved in cell wall biosynthesis